MTPRHRWSAPSRPSRFKTERQCRKCGLVKVTRHEATGGPGESHWTEFWRGLDRIECEGTPPCQPVDAAAPVGEAAHV